MENDKGVKSESETTPLIQGSEEPVKAKGGVTLTVPDSLQDITKKASEGFAAGQHFAVTQYVKAKEKTQKSPWILSIVVFVGCVGVVTHGIFSSVGKLLSLSPFAAVLKVYQVLFGLMVLIIEMSRYFDPFRVQAIVKVWCRFLDTTLGRGLFQMLPGTLAVAGWEDMGSYIPGLLLIAIGVINIFYGVYTAWKLRQVINKMKELEKEAMANRRSSSGDLSQIDLMTKKFQAIDINGSGQLTKQDLLQACQELKIDLSPEDANLVFSALDRNQKGYVDLKDFEQWWFKSKASGLFV